MEFNRQIKSLLHEGLYIDILHTIEQRISDDLNLLLYYVPI
jgi:hypothetical protein